MKTKTNPAPERSISSPPINSETKRIVAIRGSKGGVGASVVATNLGIFLAQIGKRVLLVDADFNNGLLHTWLGQVQPHRFINEVIFDDESIEKVATATPITGLYLLAGAKNFIGGEVLTQIHLNRFWHKLEAVDADFVILDIPSNFDEFTVNAFCRADYSVLVTLPLPDSVEATYRFITAAWLHKLSEQLLGQEDLIAQFITAIKKNVGKPLSPRQLTEQLDRLDKEAANQARYISTTFHPKLIVNQIKIKEDENLGDAMVSAATRWLGVNPMVLGTIGWDDNVWLSLRRSRILLTEFARSRACKDLEQIIRKMMSLEHKELFSPSVIPPPTNKQNYYELLEIFPGASEEEIRRAYKQIRNWFGLEGLAVRGAATESQRCEFETAVEQAHAKLLDRSERRLYDRENFPDGFGTAADVELHHRDSIAGTVAVTQESLPRVTLTEDDFVDGKFLAKIRKNRNVELGDISNRAKVSIRYLKSIEEERFSDLPAPVFTRGFVMEFARFLKIDAKRAATDFMNKYESTLKRKK